MNIVLFAGGVGSRLWPLSRKNTPKQFGKIIGDKTMLQLAVAKLFPTFSWKDIFISTGMHYAENVYEQLPELPKENVLVEPEMRDVGPAVGLVTALFVKKAPNEPLALLWGSDHLVREEELFRKALQTAESLVRKDPNKIIFIGQKPRFASQNLGYIEFGKQTDTINTLPIYPFKGFQYRPHLSTAEKWVKDGRHSWNLGYFVTTPQFLWKLFKEFAPELYEKLKQIHDVIDTVEYDKILREVYPTIEKISFDNAVLEKIDPKYASVISVDLRWSDIGAWEALKEALEKHETDNVIRGNALLEDALDTLVFNFTKQLVVGIDLDGMVVVNTDDVTLICPKTSVPKIKKIVESLQGTSNEHLV